MKTSSILALAALSSPVVCGGGGGHGGKKQLVSSKALQKDVTLKNLLAGSQKLQDFADANGGNRAFGGGGHNATVDYLVKELLATGYYDVFKQPFVELFTAASVKFSAGGTDYLAEYMTYGPSGEVSNTELVAVNNLGCTLADFPAAVSGKVALISRGECTFQIKAENAKASGAAAAVIYNNVDGRLSGTLGAVSNYAPTIGVTKEVGTELLTKIQSGPTLATISVKAIEENRTNYNVIAETKEGDHNNVLMLGGHTDSVFGGPGINDDGSGTIGSLVVAKALAKYKIKNAVRFGFWGAEEFGKLGSFYYMKTLNGTIDKPFKGGRKKVKGSPKEAHKVRAYLNFDMIASPNYVLGIYDGDGSAFNFSGPAGSDTIEKDFQDFYKSKGKPFVPSVFSGRSDYAAFLENGIASGGLFTGAEEPKTEEEAQLFGGTAGLALDPNYHQKGDTIDNLNKEAFLLNAQSIANSVAKYALSFQGIPRPSDKHRRDSADRYRFNARMEDHAHGMHAAPCGHLHDEL